MEIQVNGEKKVFELEALSLKALLKEIGIDPEQTGIAVAINYSVVSRSSWDEAVVKAGDEVEVITARQGG